MKKFSLLFLIASVSLSVPAQRDSRGIGKNKEDNKVKLDRNTDRIEDKSRHDKRVWEGTHTNEKDGPKPSKNQPAKVIQSFQRDYPNTSYVSWSKFRGDWTATFRNGIWTSTAVYHANGDRRDTRTPVRKEDIPGKILDIIIKKRPEIKIEDVIKIEVPKTIRDIFRIKNIIQGNAEFRYFDSDGNEVSYDY